MFRILAPSPWGPFLLRLHRFTLLPGDHLMSDVTSSPLWIESPLFSNYAVVSRYLLSRFAPIHGNRPLHR